MKKNTRIILALCAPLSALSAANAATIVYQDGFLNDTLATNVADGGGFGGIGGGAANNTISVASWSDNGDASYDNVTGSGGNRAMLSSINGFSLVNGFTMTVEYTATNNLLERFSIGLMGEDPNLVSDNNNWLGTNKDHYGIGLNISDDGIQGLNFADDAGAGSLTQLSDAQSVVFGNHTLVLTVTAADQYSYSIDGATATTGEIVAGAGVFDLSKTYYFAAYGQDDGTSARSIQSVTITAVPEPSSAALLGLGGLALMLRRRK